MSSKAKVLLGSLLIAVAGCNSQDTPPTVAGSCPIVGGNAEQAQAQPLSQSLPFSVRSHIPNAINQYSDRGRLSDEEQMPVTIALNLNNEAELDQRIADMYQPGNPNFHKFISSEEFKARYAPTDDQVNQAKSFLSSHGLQTMAVNVNGFMISAMGTAGQLNDAFQSEIHEYADAQGVTYFAPANEPQMPDSLSIRAVHGLDNMMKFKSYAHPLEADANDVSPRLGSGPSGGMSPSDIRGAYQVPTSVNGAGQVIAVAEFDGYNASDIANYAQTFGLNAVPLQNILIDGASGTPGSGAGEVTLDIELVNALAPGASKILVYESTNSGQAILDLYSRIANDDTANIVSTSWGSAEGSNNSVFLETENVIFKSMASKGMSVFAATGDSGAYDNGSSLSVDDPASQPFVVAVGGTHLNANGGVYESETSWNDGKGSAGGGGVSALWSQPSWQNGAVSGASGGSGSMRNVPDVSLNADPNTGYSIIVGGRWVVYGGTSCAAPLWAAFTALVNEKRVSSGLGTLGFPDPYLYAIGKGAQYNSEFNDVVQGTNLYYPSVTGWDDATGWGSFKGQSLFNELSTDPQVSAAALGC